MGAERERRFLSRSPDATERLGEELGRALGPGAVVALEGELGAGKTTWVRGFARGLGVLEPVTSPTFCLMQEYAGRLPLYHFDAWMAGREAHFLEGGGAEYFHAEGVSVVEWAERVADWLPLPRLALTLAHRTPKERELRLCVVTGSGPDAALASETADGLWRVLRGLSGTNADGLEELP